jgi:hypothetical protein
LKVYYGQIYFTFQKGVRMFKVLMLGLMFVAISAMCLFAADGSTASVTLPTWAQAILAVLGAGAVGGSSIFALVAGKIARINRIVQDLKDAINAIILLLGQLKATVKDGPLVPDWNDSIDHIIALLKDLPFGIAAKADLLAKLKIAIPVTLPPAPAVVEKVVQVIQAVPVIPTPVV